MGGLCLPMLMQVLGIIKYTEFRVSTRDPNPDPAYIAQLEARAKKVGERLTVGRWTCGASARCCGVRGEGECLMAAHPVTPPPLPRTHTACAWHARLVFPSPP